MKKTLLTILQIAVTVAILWFIFKDPVKRAEMADAVSQAKIEWLIAAVAAIGVVVVAGSLRWWILLRVQDIILPKTRIFALFMIGLFFNFLMPGGTGGDVIKIFYLLRETPGKKTGAVLATLIDRVVGLLGLILVAAVVMPFKYGTLVAGASPTRMGMIYSFFFIVGAALSGMGFASLVSKFNLAEKLPAKFPGRAGIVDLAIAFNAYAKHWPTTLVALLLSAVVHLATFMAFYFAALALSVREPIVDFFSVMPIVQTLASMPISLSGIGVRELVFKEFLPASLAAKRELIGTIGYLATLVWGLFGGIAFLLYRKNNDASLSQMENEVEALEKKIADAP